MWVRLENLLSPIYQMAHRWITLFFFSPRKPKIVTLRGWRRLRLPSFPDGRPERSSCQDESSFLSWAFALRKYRWSFITGQKNLCVCQFYQPPRGAFIKRLREDVSWPSVLVKFWRVLKTRLRQKTRRLYYGVHLRTGSDSPCIVRGLRKAHSLWQKILSLRDFAAESRGVWECGSEVPGSSEDGVGMRRDVCVGRPAPGERQASCPLPFSGFGFPALLV